MMFGAPNVVVAPAAPQSTECGSSLAAGKEWNGRRWIATKTAVETTSYLWKIADFRKHFNANNSIACPPVTVTVLNCKFVVELHFKDGHGQHFRFVKIRLRRLQSTQPVLAIFAACIINESGQDVHKVEEREFFRLYDNTCYSYDRFVSGAELFDQANGIVVGNILTIRWEVSIRISNTVHIGDQMEPPTCIEPVSSPKNELSCILKEGIFSDITLCAGDREFPAHKVILAAHSSVFRAMFEVSMKENIEGRVVIEDLSGDAVEQMLSFVYTGSVENFGSIAGELLAAADKYEIKKLKPVCELELATHLNSQNSVESLCLSDLHGAEFLKSVALYWIARNLHDVMRTDGWKRLREQRHMDLIHLVLNEVANLMRQMNSAPLTVTKSKPRKIE